MLYFLVLCFLGVPGADTVTLTVSGDIQAANLSIVLHNPENAPIQITQLTIEVPNFLEFARDEGAFQAALGPFAKLELDLDGPMPAIKLTLHESRQFIEAGGDLKLAIGQFSGPHDWIGLLQPTLAVTSPDVDYPRVPFEVFYATLAQTGNKQEPYFQVTSKKFGPERVPQLQGCETTIIVYPPRASSRCGSSQPCYPDGLCRLDGTYSTTVAYGVTLSYQNCDCDDTNPP